MTTQRRLGTLTRLVPTAIKTKTSDLYRSTGGDFAPSPPLTSGCGLCGHHRQVGETHSGEPSKDCSPGRQALEVIDASGQLAMRRHVTSTDAAIRPVPQKRCRIGGLS